MRYVNTALIIVKWTVWLKSSTCMIIMNGKTSRSRSAHSKMIVKASTNYSSHGRPLTSSCQVLSRSSDGWLRHIQKSCRQKDNFNGDENQKLVVPRTVVVEVASPSIHLVMFYMFWALWRNSCMWGITEPSTSPINCSGSCGSAQFTWMIKQIVGTQSSTWVHWSCPSPDSSVIRLFQALF